MKSFMKAAIIALIAAATASPSSRRALTPRDGGCIVQTVDSPSDSDVKASIMQWAKDVSEVNSFLDTIGQITDPATILAHTQAVQPYAQDEPCQLATLTNAVKGTKFETAAFDCAIADLGNVFQGGVLNNLGDIVTFNGALSTATQAVENINVFRCCNVLPDVDLIWLDSSDEASLNGDVPITAPREAACANVTCGPGSSTCRADDNGNDG